MKISKKRLYPLSLAALGVVFGDIGTSPLYALHSSLLGVPVNSLTIFGVLSLIFWSLILVVSVKYLCIILRADNDGEGGVLAVLALLKRLHTGHYKLFLLIAVLGAGLLLGDGMLTPAISVLSAVEGLEVITPNFANLILPFTLIILVTLFCCQHWGTAKIGGYFAPLLLLWFFVLAALGLIHIFDNPHILSAVNPYYAYLFFKQNGLQAYLLLGGIFLVMTGAEALYADLGHFGKTPIRLSWFIVVLPALLLNYFGQGAYLLKFPEAIKNPFYAIAPHWFLIPLLVIATLATIIASHAVISATFSLARQAILLDFCPRLRIVQTSAKEKGQIYVPQMNAVLLTGTILLILIFRSSAALTHAYGIAVNLVMLTVTLLVTCVAYQHWRWALWKVILVFGFFLLIDFAFLGANLHKVLTGGWIPLLFALVCAFIMITWHQGIAFLQSFYLKMEKKDLSEMVAEMDEKKLHLLQDTTTIFVRDSYDKRASGFLHYLNLTHSLPEHVLLISVEVKNHPYVISAERFHLKDIGHGIFHLVLHYGFMEMMDIPEALNLANKKALLPFHVDVQDATFMVDRLHISMTYRKRTFYFFWQEKLFSFLMNNAYLDIEFFGLPYDRTIAIGTYCEI